METQSIHEKSQTDAHGGQTHVMSAAALILVFSCLIVLTCITVGAAQISLGVWEVWVSLGIASVKAALVAAYFMHLRYDNPFNAIVFISSLLFVGLFLALTLMDLHY